MLRRFTETRGVMPALASGWTGEGACPYASGKGAEL